MATKHPKASNTNTPGPIEDLTVQVLNWPCLKLIQAGQASQHLSLDVSVSPNAKKTEVVGWHDGALRVRLQAPPVDGAANEALRRWLADSIGCPVNQVELIRGATSRRKQLALRAQGSAVIAWLTALQANGAFKDD